MVPSHQFQIPEEFQKDLEYTTPLDPRSDSKILADLTTHRPVTSEKNIWAFWHAGITSIPKWCQRNILDWHRICGPTWTIRVLDTVPDSPNHALKYLPADLLPETFVKGTMDGPYVGPHSADFLRGACLMHYGGVFMDVGIILTRSLDRICWAQLEDPASPFQISTPWMYGTTMANHFVASRKNDPFISRWHRLFVHLWENRTNYEGMCQNPLVSFALKQDFTEAVERGFVWEFEVGPLTVFEYVTQVVAWQRLCMLEDAGDGFSCVDYAQEKVLWWDVLSENWGFEAEVGFRGEDSFNALAVRVDADPDSEEYQRAYKMVWRFLTRSSMQKITHGKNLTKTPALGLLWDLEENEGKDIEPGTFAELLRYGTVHFRQTREEISYVESKRPAVTMKKGVFEP